MKSKNKYPIHNWKKYCWKNNLPSSSTRADALTHYIETLNNKKQPDVYYNSPRVEQFNLNFNYNKNIAIFCHTVPTPDKDSGSNRLYKILELLIESGYNIYYFTHTALENEPKYAQDLINIGVKQILSVDRINSIFCDELFNNLIKNHKINFDICIFYFYDMYYQYARKIKSICPNIKTIIDSVDVHWLRLERGSRAFSLSDKTREKECYDKADVVFAVTENDKQEILRECPRANVKILSNIHDIMDNNPRYNKNLLFIGGSNHTPNIDAALYAIDIFNTFIFNNPKYNKSKLFLVGSIFDHSILEKVAESKNIEILGHLSNTDLGDLYNKNIIGSLCPITWGAGIKGKICEAIGNSIPVITTDIGNEGINLKNNISGFICNNKEEFVQSIEKLFSLSKTEIKKLTQEAKQSIKILVSKESAKEVIEGTVTCKNIVLSIASYNNSLISERCINSIMQNTLYPNFIIHITSNGCSDNTEDTIRKAQKIYGNHKIQFTINKTNKHFILAHNETIDLYPESDIVLINNDMEFIDPNWLNHLYSSAYSAGFIGCAGGKLLDYNFKISESGACLFNNGDGINFGRGRDRDDNFMNTTRYVGYVSGCLMYMKRSIINKFGKLDDRYYPCYYEDSDWQYNLHINGYKTIINPLCEALHMEGASSSKFDNINSFKNKCMTENRYKFLSKYKDINIELYNS